MDIPSNLLWGHLMGVAKPCGPGWPGLANVPLPTALTLFAAWVAAPLLHESQANHSCWHWLFILKDKHLGMEIRNLSFPNMLCLAWLQPEIGFTAHWRGVDFISLKAVYLLKPIFFSWPHSLSKSERRQLALHFSAGMNVMQSSVVLPKMGITVFCWKMAVGPCCSHRSLWAIASAAPSRF